MSKHDKTESRRTMLTFPVEFWRRFDRLTKSAGYTFKDAVKQAVQTWELLKR